MEATPAEPDAWANSSAAILGAGDEQCAPINFSLKIDVNKPQFVVSSTVGIFTTIGNFLSIVILTKIICTRKESRNGSTFYLLALSTSDFLQALFVYPMLIKAQIGGVWSGGVASCNLMAFTGNFFQLLSAMIVSSLALIRFLATYKPFEFQMHLKRLRVWGAILALIFVVAAIVSAIPFTRYGCIALYPSSGVCSYNFQAGGARRISLVLILVLNELALLSIIVFTIGTIISLNAAARSSTRERKNERRFSFGVVTIAIVQVVFWGPMQVWLPITLSGVVESGNINTMMYTISGYLLFFVSVWNPIVFAGMMRQYRVEFRRLVCCVFCLRRHDDADCSSCGASSQRSPRHRKTSSSSSNVSSKLGGNNTLVTRATSSFSKADQLRPLLVDNGCVDGAAVVGIKMADRSARDETNI